MQDLSHDILNFGAKVMKMLNNFGFYAKPSGGLAEL
jgi:hypothetical protein